MLYTTKKEPTVGSPHWIY